jgi:protein TonB
MQILKPDWLEVLFDRRNKEYGAYELRKNYERRLRNAIALMIGICLVLVGSYAIAARMNKKTVARLDVPPEVILTDATLEKKVELPPVIPKPHIAVQPVITLRDVTTRIVRDIDVKPEEVPPANADLDNVKIGTNTNLNGSTDDGIPGPIPGNGAGNGIMSQPEVHDDNVDSRGIFIKVENESYYPGGTKDWIRFLLKNFHTPDEAISNGVSGTVVVQFIVDKDGNMSDVHAISGPELLRPEAERVIKKSGKWEPAIQNGRKVPSYKKQPIVVQLQDQ